MLQQELVSYLNDYLQVSLFNDPSLNGLQVEGFKECTKIATACTASLEAFMDNLDIERAKECCFEYDRFFDLRRFGLGTKEKFTDKVKARSVKHKNNFTSGKEWMPIPRSEVDNNPNLTQNEGF